MEKKYNNNKNRGYRNDNNGAGKRPQYKSRAFEREADVPEEGLVVGRNAVRELLKSDRDIDKIFVQRGEREGSIVVLVAEATAKHIPLVEVDRVKLDSMTGGANHQ
ncbi:MAG: 23S rRNA (guanosine(2251)-2'-O)-methyltransferase RlmB, partial [Clostridia bacterium]|nr:23S rRNA (guanosine(2251)-2'-O)-methyltransferase RlmB [Clostridia bacterium]